MISGSSLQAKLGGGACAGIMMHCEVWAATCAILKLECNGLSHLRGF